MSDIDRVQLRCPLPPSSSTARAPRPLPRPTCPAAGCPSSRTRAKRWTSCPASSSPGGGQEAQRQAGRCPLPDFPCQGGLDLQPIVARSRSKIPAKRRRFRSGPKSGRRRYCRARGWIAASLGSRVATPERRAGLVGSPGGQRPFGAGGSGERALKSPPWPPETIAALLHLKDTIAPC